MSSGIMQLLDWKQFFFLFAMCCIAVHVDRMELALAATESRLMVPVQLSSWSVPTPPVQVMAHRVENSMDGQAQMIDAFPSKVRGIPS